MTDVAARITKVITEHLDVAPSKVTPDARFTDDLGADSLDQVELIMALEEEFEIEITDKGAESIIKVGDAIKYIEEQLKKNLNDSE